MSGRRHLVLTTARGTEVYVEPGMKSPNDFVVRYREPHLRRLRTPKHIHLIIDLYMKRTADRPTTMALVDHVLDEILAKVEPATSFPPTLRSFSPEHVTKFQSLDGYGEYSVDFLLSVLELIMVQEKTNYPNGTMNAAVFRAFRQDKDLFTIVSLATFRGR